MLHHGWNWEGRYSTQPNQRFAYEQIVMNKVFSVKRIDANNIYSFVCTFCNKIWNMIFSISFVKWLHLI